MTQTHFAPVYNQYDTELHTLAATLLHSDVADVTLDTTVLHPTDFIMSDDHPRIYTAMRAVHKSGEPFAIASLAIELERRGWSSTKLYLYKTVATALDWQPTPDDVAAWIRSLIDARQDRVEQDLQVKIATAVNEGRMDDARALLTANELPTDKALSDDNGSVRFLVRGEDALSTLPPVEFLNRELGIAARQFYMTYGASGCGKTFVAIEHSSVLASNGYRVIYIATEDLLGLRTRRAAWRKAHPTDTGHLMWLDMPHGLDLQDELQVSDLITALQPHKPEYIVIDTLREAHTGNENDSQDGARINRAVQRLIRELGTTVNLIHHSGVAGDRARGSTALFANCDVVLKVDNDDGMVRVAFEKPRGIGGPREPLSFTFVPQDSGLTDSDGEPVVSAILRPTSQMTIRVGSPLTQSEKKVLETLALSIFVDTGAKERQIVLSAQVTERSVYRALSSLKNRGFVSQSSKGDPYFITYDGRAAVAPKYVTANDEMAYSSATDNTANSLTTTDNINTVNHCQLTATDTPVRGVSGSQLAVTGTSEESGQEKPLPAQANKVVRFRHEQVKDVNEVVRRRAQEHSENENGWRSLEGYE